MLKHVIASLSKATSEQLRWGLQWHISTSMSERTVSRWELMQLYVSGEQNVQDAFLDYMVGLMNATGVTPDEAVLMDTDDGTDINLLAEMNRFADRFDAAMFE